MSGKGWIGVDLDGTLAHYDTWVHHEHIGEPVPAMLERVKRWLAEGREVRIFTARVHPLNDVPLTQVLHASHALGMYAVSERHGQAAEAAAAIRRWCVKHIGGELHITCVKDYAMIELWDDRAVQVRPNTGEAVGSSTRGLT